MSHTGLECVAHTVKDDFISNCFKKADLQESCFINRRIAKNKKNLVVNVICCLKHHTWVFSLGILAVPSTGNLDINRCLQGIFMLPIPTNSTKQINLGICKKSWKFA